ncbi:large ribosomal subunit protein mL46 isoform X2 [Neocloeon triangulifer]|uniref:large ribosomal subunit protein mL46 isoform X2 n=1 Tax=Neocloeon triangulifer TaxID=2078957 RepID=UPI00286EC34D|nr:large ribosomal subunit protein mL46 isoform X2 [Neocloeon triangulifer]
MSFSGTRFLSRILLCSHRNTGNKPLRICQVKYCATNEAAVAKKKWDLVSSVCVERPPVISADLTELEERMQSMLCKIELQQSIKSNHELRKEKDKVTLEALKSGNASEADLEQATKATAQDFEDSSLDELANFTLASRKNDPKVDEDEKNIDRQLSQHLILLTKHKLGSESVWLMPNSARKDGETMRQAADRALLEAVGPEFKSTILGNAPVGFYKYKYPKAVREQSGVEGAKVFFFKAMYQGGRAKSKDFVWATKEEMEKKLKKEYFNSVDQFLLF